MSVDAREGLKEALIALGLSKPFLGTGIQQIAYISAGIILYSYSIAD